MILMVDGLAKRYGLLPSEVLERCNTLDLYVMDVAMSFENYHHKKNMNGGKEPLPDYSQDELFKLLNRTKEQ